MVSPLPSTPSNGPGTDAVHGLLRAHLRRSFKYIAVGLAALTVAVLVAVQFPSFREYWAAADDDAPLTISAWLLTIPAGLAVLPVIGGVVGLTRFFGYRRALRSPLQTTPIQHGLLPGSKGDRNMVRLPEISGDRIYMVDASWWLSGTGGDIDKSADLLVAVPGNDRVLVVNLGQSKLSWLRPSKIALRQRRWERRTRWSSHPSS